MSEGLASITDGELDRLFSAIAFHARLSFVDGLDPFRALLRTASAPRVVEYLAAKLASMADKEASGVAFVLAEHYLTRSEISAIADLCTSTHAGVREGALNGLHGEPTRDLTIRTALLSVMIRACEDPEPRVRLEAARALQNQAGWKLDVSRAVEPLRKLLCDADHQVQSAAACVAGNFAKERVDITSCLLALRKNLSHERDFVREYSAWAFWQLASNHQSIESAVPDLLALVARMEGCRPAEKNALGALMRHAVLAPAHAAQVASEAAILDPYASRPPIAMFLSRVRAAASTAGPARPR